MPLHEHVIAFGPYLYDLELGHLSLGGQKIRIADQNAKLLAYLVEKSGRLAARDELRSVLWPGGAPYDSEQAINKAISQLRTALRDDPANPRYIETIPQRGYRFCAVVEYPYAPPPELSADAPDSLIIEPESSTAAPPESAPIPAGLPRAPSARKVLITSAAAFALILLGFLGWHLHDAGSSRPPISVGVAPFEATGEKAQELTTSLRLELIDGLSSSPQTRVIAATSTRNLKSDSTLPTEAAKLRLDVVIFGHMDLDAGSFQLRLELVRPSDQTHLATLRYSGIAGQLVETQTRVLRDVFHVLELKRSGRDDLGKTSNTEAYDAYLHGVYGYSRYGLADVQRSVTNFKQATQLDPNFSESWAALARSYSFLASRSDPLTQGDQREELYRDARHAAEQALRISPGLANAHDSLAIVLVAHDWKFAEAVHEQRLAVQLEPGNAGNHSNLGWGLSLTGHYAEAFPEFDLARSMDPYNPRIDLNESYADFASGDCARILGMARKVQTDMPDSAFGLIAAARSLWYCGHQQEAIADWRQAAVLSDDTLWVTREDEGLKAWRTGGDKAYALTRVVAAQQDEIAHRSNLYNEEEWDAIAGRDKEAAALIKKRFAEHDSQFLVDCILPSLVSIRKDPEIQVLVNQLYQ